VDAVRDEVEPGRVAFGASAYAALSEAAAHAKVVGTDDLIRCLLEVRAPDVRQVLEQATDLAAPAASSSGPGPVRDGRQAPRPQADCAAEVEATLREVAWRTARRGADIPQWTSGLRVALHEALAEALSAGVTRVNAGHLVCAVLADPDNRAVRLFPSTYRRITAQLRDSGACERSGPPYPNLDYVDSGLWSGRWTRRAFPRMRRLARYGLLLPEVEAAQERQAVRMGHRAVTAAHLLVALVDLDRRLAERDLRMPEAVAARNTAARRLREAGVTVDRAHAYAVWLGDEVELADAETLAARLRDGRPADPLWSRAVAGAYAAAADIALAHGHPDVGTTHLLAGLCVEAGSEVVQLWGDGGDLEARLEDDLARIRPAW